MSKNSEEHPWKSGFQAKNSKLTPKQRDEINQRKTEGEKVIDLAKEYGVSRNTIYNI